MPLINDPVHGFTPIRSQLLRDVVAHPLFQRLERIRQLGLSSFVYPGATHTRKAHSLGAYTLMQRAFRVLREKGYFIFDSEEEAAEAAMLMHDLGHGPYSHVLESEIVQDYTHEDISLMMMERINDDLHGALNLAIQIFKGEYGKPYLHELISSDELDMDRLDYLCRDAFYTGVREGALGADRLIQMLELTEDEHLTMSVKAAYPMENYRVARRLMYWQVYLHKTTVAAEEVLRRALRRARQLAEGGVDVPCTPALRYFLYPDAHRSLAPTGERCRSQKGALQTPEAFLKNYAALDDSDILCALKMWQEYPDEELARWARSFLERKLLKVHVDPETTDGYLFTKEVEKEGERHLYAFYNQNS